jgi:hypothetical protein
VISRDGPEADRTGEIKIRVMRGNGSSLLTSIPWRRDRRGRSIAGSLLLASLIISLCVAANAGARGPGRYSGVVIFDRWGGCILFSGIYLMYVSEAVKEQLRPYEGKPIEVYALEVFQPINPGDGLIRRLNVLGPAVEKERWYTIEDTKLDAQPRTVDESHVTIRLTITNDAKIPARIDASQIGFAVLVKKGTSEYALSPSDGPSLAVITRVDALSKGGPSEMRVGDQLLSYSFLIADKDRLPRLFDLGPGESKSTEIALHLPKGHYQFWAGYGGGVHEDKLIVSNPVSIEVGQSANNP